MQIDINIDVDTDEITRKARQLVEDKTRGIVHHAIDKHFRNGSQWQTPKGFGYLAIEKQIDDLLVSRDVESMVERIIAQEWETILEQQVRYQLTRKAQKVAAQTIKDGNFS